MQSDDDDEERRDAGPTSDAGDQPEQGAVIGRVQTLQNGEPVQKATVSIGDKTVEANEQGWFAVPNITSGERRTLEVEADGYASTQKIVDIQRGERVFVDTRMFERAEPQTLDASQGGKLTFGNAAIELPADALLDSSGNTFSGTANIQVTNLDPSMDNAELATPGDFTALPGESSDTAQLETYGMVELMMTDGDGNALQVADDADATLSIPVPQTLRGQSDLPASMPFWRYDQEQGRWVPENGDVQYNEQSNCYDADIGGADSSTFWNADKPYQSACLTGRVVKPSTDGGTGGIMVRAEGATYVGSSSTRTESDGSFRLNVKRSSSDNEAGVEIQAQGGGLYLETPKQVKPTPTQQASSGNCKDIGTIELDFPLARMVLGWGEKPTDLDSHFTGPVAASSEEGSASGSPDSPDAGMVGMDAGSSSGDGVPEASDERFHVYFQRMEVGNQVLLDTDDTSSFGPEVTSILRPVPGVYYYSIKNYSGESEHPIAESDANIQVFLPNEVETFKVENANDQTSEDASNPVWRVFKFRIRDDGNFGEIQPINNIVDETENVYGPNFSGDSGGSSGSGSGSPDAG